MRRLLLCCAALAWTGVQTEIAHGQDTYYMMVFSSQRPTINLPQYAHSFAAFVRVHGQPRPGQPTFDSVTISWLPRTLDIKMYHLLPECGWNVPLDVTLPWAKDHGERISMWGPYQIQPDLYERALAQAARLESGAVRYKAMDTGYPSARVSNCIHAVGDLAIGQPYLRIASPGWGDSASYYITLNFLPWIVDSRQTYPWVADLLGLRSYCLLQRNLDEKNPGNVVVRSLMRITQGRLNRVER